MRSPLLLTAAAIAAATLMAAPAGAKTGHRTTSVQAVLVKHLRQGIRWHRAMTWHYQDEAGLRRTPTAYVERRTASVPFLRWVEQRWSSRRLAAKRAAARVPAIAHRALWQCIHGDEAGWHQPSHATDVNGVPLYWGGLQMHAGWGYGTSYHASDDSPVVQMEAAERGYRASGYSETWLLGQWYHPDCLAYR